MDEVTGDIQGDIPWCMLFADDVVLVDDSRAGRAGKKARSSRAKRVARDSARIDSNSKNNESSRALV